MYKVRVFNGYFVGAVLAICFLLGRQDVKVDSNTPKLCSKIMTYLEKEGIEPQPAFDAIDYLYHIYFIGIAEEQGVEVAEAILAGKYESLKLAVQESNKVKDERCKK